MLVLSRKKDEKIVIGDSITLMVIEIRGDKVRLGIEAPRDVTVHRQEVYDAIKREAEFTDTKCPKCGSNLLSSGVCSFIGGGSVPACDFGIKS